MIREIFGNSRTVKTTRVDVRVGEAHFPLHQVVIGPARLHNGIIGMDILEVIGMDILGAPDVSRAVSQTVFGDVMDVLKAVPILKQKTVLLIGQDTTEIHRLRAIKQSLTELGYSGVIVKDIADIAAQSVEEKVNMFASLSRFVVCENSVASGHIGELKICANNRFVTAIVQQKGMGATWVQSDYPGDYLFMKSFKYADIESIGACIRQAVRWAEETIEKRRRYFDGLYAWRQPGE